MLLEQQQKDFFNFYSLNCNIWNVSNKCVGITPCQTLPHKHRLFSLKEQDANSHWAVMQATWCPRTPCAADSTEISLEESLPSAGPSPFPSLLLVPNTAQDTWLQDNTKWLWSKVHLTPRENCHIFQSTTHQERLHLPLWVKTPPIPRRDQLQFGLGRIACPSWNLRCTGCSLGLNTRAEPSPHVALRRSPGNLLTCKTG